jgi:hypothetical protein
MPDLPTPSDTVLDDMPARGLKLLGAISSNPYIRTALARRGYSDSTHEQGWSLVLKASGYRRPIAESLAKPEAAAAIAELDAWDEPNFRVARAALVMMPEQRDFLFQDLEPQTGPAAVASVATFLDRLDELESGKERKATRKPDQAALDKLAERGIAKDERTRLRKLLAVATASPDAAELPAKAPAGAAKGAMKAAEPREAKVALWAFWTEWSEVAKADIKRRDHLIQLGLAKRKAGKKGKGPAEEAGDK